MVKGVLRSCVLDRGPVDAALDARGLAHRVDLQHLVHVARRDRHHLVERGTGLDALHHRRAAAIGDRLGADPVAPVEHAHDVLLVLGEGHGIGRVGHRAHEHAHGVEARLAVAVLEPRQVIGAHDRPAAPSGTATRGAAQRDLLRLGRRRDIEAVEAVALGDLGLPGLDLFRRQVLVGIAPGIELLLPPHVSSDLVRCVQAAKATGLVVPLICVRCMMRRAVAVERIAAVHGRAVVPHHEVAELPDMLVDEARLGGSAPTAPRAARRTPRANSPRRRNCAAARDRAWRGRWPGCRRIAGCQAPGAAMGSSVGVTPLRR